MQQSQSSDSTAKSLLATSLANAHALEKQALAVMSQQNSQLGELPDAASFFRQRPARAVSSGDLPALSGGWRGAGRVLD